MVKKKEKPGELEHLQCDPHQNDGTFWWYEEPSGIIVFWEASPISGHKHIPLKILKAAIRRIDMNRKACGLKEVK